jgi:hypothetical protein
MMLPRLDIKMNHILPVQIVQGCGNFQPDLDNLGVGQRQLGEPLQQRFSRNAFHHDIGLHAEVARRNELWNVDAGQARQNHLLHLEADDRRRILAFGEFRYLHQHRRRRARA